MDNARRALLLVAGLLGFVPLARAGDAKTDQDNLQGTWDVVQVHTLGQTRPVENMIFKFKGEKFSIGTKTPDQGREFLYKLNPTKLGDSFRNLFTQQRLRPNSPLRLPVGELSPASDRMRPGPGRGELM